MLKHLYKVFQQISLILILIVIGLYTLIWAFSPWVINYYLEQYLEPQGLILSDETSIRVNPFRFRIEVNSLAIARDETDQVLVLPYMDVELHLHKLLFEEIYIPTVNINGLDITVEKVKNDIVLAGISLANTIPATKADSVRQDRSSPVIDAEAEQSSDSVYPLIIPSFILENSEVDFYDEKGLHQLELSEVRLDRVWVSPSAQTFQLKVDSELDQGPIDISIAANFVDMKGEAQIEVDIIDIDVERFSHLLPKDIDSLVGLVSYQGEQRFSMDDENLIFNIDEGSFSSKGLNAGKKDAHILIGKQVVSFKDSSVHMFKDPKTEQYGQPDIKANVSILVEDINVYNKNKTKILAAIKEMNLNTIDVFKSEGGIQKLSVKEFNIVDSFFSDNKDNEIPALMKFSSLNIKDVGLSPFGVEVGDITLAGLIANAELDENKKLRNLLDLPNSSNGTIESVDGAEGGDLKDIKENQNDDLNNKEEVAFNIKLNSFSLTDGAEVFFLDKSVKPAYQRKMVINTFTAGPFDTEKPNQESIVSISGKSNRYANFSFVTKAKPFLNKPSYDISGSFKELSLPGLSSYIKEALQYEIESGQLDLGLDVQLVGTELEGEVDVMLRGIELTAADDYETSSLNDQTSVPFNMALGMLKDSNGNVELTLPISGDTNSPNFGVSGFLTLLVKQATIMGAKDYLVTTFVPYASVVNIAVLAGEYALKVRINDLEYPDGMVELQPEQEVFLQQFSALLKHHDTTQVKLCAIATAKDIGQNSSSETVSDESIKALNDISRQRVDLFKEYMIEKEKIPSSRLLLCTPQIDSSLDAKPRLSFET